MPGKIIQRFIDTPYNYPNPEACYKQGDNPKILDLILKWFSEQINYIKAISTSHFLFNNKYFLQPLIEISKMNRKVRIFTIPLAGYDMSMRSVIDISSNETSQGSKRQFAEEVYEEAKKQNTACFQMWINPKRYAFSKDLRPYARGENGRESLPYAHHDKKILVELTNGKAVLFSTSNNFVVGDPPKFEHLLQAELDQLELEFLQNDFKKLEEMSVPINSYREEPEKLYYRYVQPVSHTSVKQPDNLMLISPSYTNSGKQVIDRVGGEMLKVEKRLYISVEHIAMVSGLISSDLAKTLNSRGVNVTCISARYVTPPGVNQNLFGTETYNTQSFTSFQALVLANPRWSLYFHPSMHGKIIIADDIVILSSFNYSPTQFLYGEDIDIPYFTYYESYISYRGDSSEIGHCVIIKNKELADYLVSQIDNFIMHPSTICCIKGGKYIHEPVHSERK